MVWLHCCNVMFIILLCSIVDASWQSPFDIRIDHYKVETIGDLVINTPRPRFSWKIPLLNKASQRNIQ